MSTRILGLVLALFIGFYGVSVAATTTESLEEDGEISTSTVTSTQPEAIIMDDEEESDEPKGIWGRIVQKLENKIEESVEISEKAKSEPSGFFSKFGGFQKKMEGIFKKLNNDPS